MATYSVKGVELLRDKTKRLAREQAERDRLAAVEKARLAKIEAERLAVLRAAEVKRLEAVYIAKGQSKYYAELYQPVKVDWSRYGGNTSMHKINRQHAAGQQAALKRSAGGSVGAYIFAREKGRTISQAKSYARDASRITPIA